MEDMSVNEEKENKNEKEKDGGSCSKQQLKSEAAKDGGTNDIKTKCTDVSYVLSTSYENTWTTCDPLADSLTSGYVNSLNDLLNNTLDKNSYFYEQKLHATRRHSEMPGGSPAIKGQIKRFSYDGSMDAQRGYPHTSNTTANKAVHVHHGYEKDEKNLFNGNGSRDTADQCRIIGTDVNELPDNHQRDDSMHGQGFDYG